MPLPNGIIKKDESVYWAGKGEFLLFVPDFYFDMKLAVITGEFVSVLGVLNYAISTDSNTYGKIRQFYFPSMFTTKPGYIEKIKNFALNLGLNILKEQDSAVKGPKGNVEHFILLNKKAG